MGASDTIEADVPCPQCGDIYYLRCETTLFAPTYDEQRTLSPGVPWPLARLPVATGWSRVRGALLGPRFTVLADLDEMSRCACGCPCVPVLHFLHEAGTILLERVELLDARGDITPRVDLARLAGRDLTTALAAKFAERPDLGRWTALSGPTRCEACGDTRERLHLTLLATSHARVGQLFGSEWQGRAIMIGDRIPTSARRSAADVVVEGDPGSWGCRCGAGPARYVARFESSGDALVLVDLAFATSV